MIDVEVNDSFHTGIAQDYCVTVPRFFREIYLIPSKSKLDCTLLWIILNGKKITVNKDFERKMNPDKRMNIPIDIRTGCNFSGKVLMKIRVNSFIRAEEVS